MLDVWFDASVAFASRRVKLPADAVIEGADQYRGWFQALALCCAVLKAKPAFKAVIAHPLVMSSKTEKMSKSKTGVWLKSTAEAGANLVRAWACSVDAVEAQAVDASWLLRPSKL